MPNSIKLEGWKDFEKKTVSLPQHLFEEFQAEVEDGAAHWEELAKRDCKSTQIAANITSRPTGKMQAEVVSPIFFSPYEEWGTGSRAVVPSDLESYASFWWTHKIHVGRFPRAFFFIQAPLVEKYTFGNIQKILETAH